MGHGVAKSGKRLLCSGLLLTAVLQVTAPGSDGTRADVARVPEYHLKTAFLYSFTKFVQWPQDSFPAEDSPFVLGILNAHALESSLRLIRGRSVRGHTIVIKTCHSPRDVRDCHMVYLNSTDTLQVRSFVRQALGHAVLTVGDTTDFLEMRGMIRFHLDKNKLRFRINTEATKASRLNISAQLLEISRGQSHVEKGGKP